ncbi:hypothetical protein OV079_38255 [Nannocystis pusilla]|uniref:Uncharacterized protein n=1 Tax=Nannocystis pusilla TaxID=889268 RepID=A0A9X3J1N3_9BACT|nr:hypothetical protein [Nannocystis pusilla]MCY1011305.1 hypothetical protein [Nannocystis pusilla]
MRIFKRITSIVRRLFRAAGVDEPLVREAALAEAFTRKRAAFVSFVAQSALSEDLKGRLIRSAAKCSRWDELKDKVENMMAYIQDLHDGGGEDIYETLRVTRYLRSMT